MHKVSRYSIGFTLFIYDDLNFKYLLIQLDFEKLFKRTVYSGTKTLGVEVRLLLLVKSGKFMRQQIWGVIMSAVTGKCEVWWQLTPLLRHSPTTATILLLRHRTLDTAKISTMYTLHAIILEGNLLVEHK